MPSIAESVHPVLVSEYSLRPEAITNKPVSAQ